MSDRSIAVFDHDSVFAAIAPSKAIALVEDAFLRFARGEWTMPPKVYLQPRSGGDFRAMPAMGGGLAILKWVTSFPDNPKRGLPTVTGIVLVSDSGNGEPLALVDARAVTALRTGASAAVATRALAADGARTAGAIGCGLHGAWAARCLRELGFTDGICADVDAERARSLAEEVGWSTGTTAEALECDVVTTVTPGQEPVVRLSDLRAGTHLNALGADGSGKAEFEIAAVAACRVFVDEWEQASHGGEITGAVAEGRLDRDRVTELGRVLTGEARGRSGPDDITLFDSTGLAIQDLAIVRALMEGLGDGSLSAPQISL